MSWISLCIDSYKSYDFTAIFHLLGDYCSTELSSFYLDIVKDRLYVEHADGKLRRSTQTACFIILDTMTKLMAPILSFTAEQISDSYQKDKTDSIHLQNFPDQITTIKQTIDWELLKEFRSSILKAIEEKREKQEIKHSLEAHVIVYIDIQSEYGKKITEILKLIEQGGENKIHFLKEFVIVSQFSCVDKKKNLSSSTIEGIYIKIEKATGEKCPRCWNYDSTNHTDGLCNRCQKILTK